MVSICPSHVWGNQRGSVGTFSRMPSHMFITTLPVRASNPPGGVHPGAKFQLHRHFKKTSQPLSLFCPDDGGMRRPSLGDPGSDVAKKDRNRSNCRCLTSARKGNEYCGGARIALALLCGQADRLRRGGHTDGGARGIY